MVDRLLPSRGWQREGSGTEQWSQCRSCRLVLFIRLCAVPTEFGADRCSQLCTVKLYLLAESEGYATFGLPGERYDRVGHEQNTSC